MKYLIPAGADTPIQWVYGSLGLPLWEPIDDISKAPVGADLRPAPECGCDERLWKVTSDAFVSRRKRWRTYTTAGYIELPSYVQASGAKDPQVGYMAQPLARGYIKACGLKVASRDMNCSFGPDLSILGISRLVPCTTRPKARPAVSAEQRRKIRAKKEGLDYRENVWPLMMGRLRNDYQSAVKGVFKRVWPAMADPFHTCPAIMSDPRMIKVAPQGRTDDYQRVMHYEQFVQAQREARDVLTKLVQHLKATPGLRKHWTTGKETLQSIENTRPLWPAMRKNSEWSAIPALLIWLKRYRKGEKTDD